MNPQNLETILFESGAYMRAIESTYPVPDNPHQSVVQRALDNRVAFRNGWDSAVQAVVQVLREQETPEYHLADTVLRIQSILGATTTGFISPDVIEHKIAYLQRNQITQELQGMADCMHMVRQELIEAGVIDKETPPMMISDEIVVKVHSVLDALTAARDWIVSKRPSLLFSSQSVISSYFKLITKIEIALGKDKK